MSQIIKIKKFEEGGVSPNVNRGRKLTVRADGQLYDIYEKDLRAGFEKYQKDTGRYGKNRGDWNSEFNTLIDNIEAGQSSGNYFDLSLGDSGATRVTFDGDLTNEQRGFTESGKRAKPGLLSGITGVKNKGAINSALLGFMGSFVANSVSSYNAAEQKKYDEEQAKLKAEREEAEARTKALKTDAISDNLNRWSFDRYFIADPLNDRTGVSREDLIRQYHGNPDQQAAMDVNYLRRLQAGIRQNDMDSDEAIDIFNSGNALDYRNVRSYLDSIDLDDVNINHQEVFDNIGLGNQYRSLRGSKGLYEQMLLNDKISASERQKASDELAGNASSSSNDGGTGGTGGTDKSKFETDTEGNLILDDEGNPIPKKETVTGVFNLDGYNWDNYGLARGTVGGIEQSLYDFQNRVFGQDYTPTEEEQSILNTLYADQGQMATLLDAYRQQQGWSSFEDKSNWQTHRPTSTSSVKDESLLSKVASGMASTSSSNPMRSGRGDAVSTGSNFNYNPYRGIASTYEDASKILNDVDSYRVLTPGFTGVKDGAVNGKYHIVQETLKNNNSLMSDLIPQTRIRVLGKNGIIEGAEVTKGRTPGSRVLVIPKPDGTKEEFFLGSYGDADKKVRVQYKQDGGPLSFTAKTADASAVPSQSLGTMLSEDYTMTDADRYELGALLADVTTLGATFAPGGGVVAGTAGVGSSVATALARSSRGEKWGGNLAADLALDGLTVLPIAGPIAKGAKTARSLVKMAPWLKKALGAASLGAGGKASVEAMNNILNGDMSVENWSVLTKGLTALATGKRLTLDNKLAFKSGSQTHSTKVNVKGKDVDLELTPGQMNSLNGKSLDDQKKIVKEILDMKSTTPTKLDDIIFDTTKGMGRTGKLKIGKVDKGIKTTTATGAKDLRTQQDLDSTNPLTKFFQERAVKRAVRQDPSLNFNADGSLRYNRAGFTYGDMNLPKRADVSTITPTNTSVTAAASPLEPKLLPAGGTPSQRYNTKMADEAKNAQLRLEEVEARINRTKAEAKEAVHKRTKKAREAKAKKREDASKELEKQNEEVLQGLSNRTVSTANLTKPTPTEIHASITPPVLNSPTSWQKALEISKIKSKKDAVEEARRLVNMSNINKYRPKPKPKVKTQVKGKNQGRPKNRGGKKTEKKLEGGILKFQNSGKFKFPTIKPVTPSFNLLPNDGKSRLIGYRDTTVRPKFNIPKSLDSSRSNTSKMNSDTIDVGEYAGDGGGTTSAGTNLGVNVNRNDLSEWARAYANRRAHGQLDTRMSAPILTAPTQIGNAIRGDFLTKSAYANSANNLRNVASRNRSSDASLNLASNLALERQAQDLNLQGDLASASSIRQQEDQARQLDQQFANIRTDIANQNMQTLAGKEQAERQARNTRHASMFKSLDNAWMRQNAMGYQKERELQGIENQLHMLKSADDLITEGDYKGQSYRQATMDLQSKYSDLTNRINASQSDTERLRLIEERNMIDQKSREFSELIQKNSLENMKTAPRPFTERLGVLFGKGKDIAQLTAPKKKKGGKLTFQERVYLKEMDKKQKSDDQWLKHYNKFIENSANNTTKRAIASERELSALIRKVLAGK